MLFNNKVICNECTAYLEILVMYCESGRISCIPGFPGQTRGDGKSACDKLDYHYGLNLQFLTDGNDIIEPGH